MSKQEVKDCPFCGGNEIYFGAFNISADCTVHCVDCGGGTDSSVPWGDMDREEHDEKCYEHLVELWNQL